MSFGTPQGEVLIPTVVNGRVVSDQEAIAHYRQTGEHLGIFRTPEEATAYAQSLHEDQAREYLPRADGTNSFRSSAYAPIEARFEQQYGLPAGLLSRIRTRGERSNADQVSSAGARSVYQFTPDTRRLFMQRYGIDPWSSPEAGAQAAALHLRDSHDRTGSWERAVTEYIGGPDPRHWGPQTRAYVGRVTG